MKGGGGATIFDLGFWVFGQTSMGSLISDFEEGPGEVACEVFDLIEIKEPLS